MMKTYFCILLITVMSMGCAAQGLQSPSLEGEGEVLFSDQRFSVQLLEAGGASMLPMANLRVSEGIRDNAVYEVQQALGIYIPKMKLKTKSETLSQAKGFGWDKRIKDLVNDYERHGNLDPQFVQQLSVVTETRYFFYLKVKDYDFNIQQGMATKRVVLEAELWDSVCLKVVWSGSGKVGVVEPVQSERVRFEEIFVSAARNLVIPLSREGKRGITAQGCVS